MPGLLSAGCGPRGRAAHSWAFFVHGVGCQPLNVSISRVRHEYPFFFVVNFVGCLHMHSEPAGEMIQLAARLLMLNLVVNSRGELQLCLSWGGTLALRGSPAAPGGQACASGRLRTSSFCPFPSCPPHFPAGSHPFTG